MYSCGLSGALFDRSSFMMLCGFLVMLSGLFVMQGGFGVVFCNRGFSGHQDGPVAADDPNRDLDDTHFWKLSDQGSNFAIEAYFVGPRTNYHTISGIHADNVDVAAFLEGLKRGTKLPDPLTKSDPETGRLTYTWTAKADGGKDALKVAAYKNGRVSITFTYSVIAR